MKVLKVAAIVIGAVALAATGVGLAAGAGLVGAFGAGAAGIGTALGISSGIVAGAFGAALALDFALLANAVLPRVCPGGPQTKWKTDDRV